jgi:hypothetical protein
MDYRILNEAETDAVSGGASGMMRAIARAASEMGTGVRDNGDLPTVPDDVGGILQILGSPLGFLFD